MNECTIKLAGAHLHPLDTGALHWPERNLLVVADLHLGKSARIARRTGTFLPPYESRDTLARLSSDLDKTSARRVICLGDSFDDLDAATQLSDEDAMTLLRLQAGRDWIWIEGNHDPGPVALGGSHLAELIEGPLTFRHIAQPESNGEVSGHFHPKARLLARGRSISRPCFLYDVARLILPAYGTYTGGLSWTASPIRTLLQPEAQAVLLGKPLRRVPVPQGDAA